MIKIIALVGCFALVGCGGFDTGPDNSGDAAALVLGGAAFLNGMSQGSRPLPMVTTSCNQTGGMVNCLSW